MPSLELGPLPVVVNRSGGTAASLGDSLGDTVRSAFAAAGRRIDLHLVDGEGVDALVRGLASAPILVIGGGDGTIGGAAQARVESGGGALGILPLGTRNHLAGELGIPSDLTAAAAAIVAGSVRHIDLAMVNDTAFVNNASVGLYPLMVRWRDAERKRKGIPKWLATLPATWATLRRLPHHRLRLRGEGIAEAVVTPLLFVGNNRYTLERGRVGKRVALDDGLLSVFAVGARSRLGMVWFALRTMLGFSNPGRDFAAIGDCAAFTVSSPSATIDIALDGEVRRMATPLMFSLRRRGLAVIVPADARSQDVCTGAGDSAA
ncbi:MAG: diacylglycerol kinase family lipid kinase [Sphingomonas bacterium]|nr:diacylglycerol kinase family protein [Sphingomonas bacterium]MDB5690098.1 diacylglycerol kinase family lipid kinase [Sphingomonas bacterium]